MAHTARTLTALATVLITVAACGSAAAPSTSGPAGNAQFHAAGGTPLTLSPRQLLAATGDIEPVAFGKPNHGKISYGANGVVIYTPDSGFVGTDEFSVTTSRAVKLYAEDQLPLATMAGVSIKAAAHGSAIAAVPGNADEIYGLTDRGPNVDGRTPGEKVLPLPDFHPQIAKLKLSDGVATVQRTVMLYATDGVPLVGLVDPHAATGESLVDLDATPLPPSDYGIDPEGLVVTRDGTFWVSDEYGPYIIHFDANGKELERLSPFDGTLPPELSLRTPNQGLEGLTMTPDGNTLVAIMQSAIQTPGLQGPPQSVPVTRIVTVNLVDRNVVHEYLYPLANPQQTHVGVSEITALSPTTFLVDESDSKFAPNADKKIYLVDLARATDVGPRSTLPGAVYKADAGGLLINQAPIETFVGTSTDGEAVKKLKEAGIAVVAKTLKLDLGGLVRSLSPSGDFFGHNKIEGMITPDEGDTLIIANDSDFGLAGLASDAPPFRLKPKTLPNGTQDSGEFLIVDTTKLPAKTEQVTISIRVG
ncbi:esterase-like activity of phytase family protein [Mycobacterium vicinigordonae]